MNTTVNLQDAFSYAMWPMIALGSALILMLGFLFVLYLMRKLKKRKPKPVPVSVKPAPVAIDVLRSKYLSELAKLTKAFNEGQIELREAYQKMSSIIRNFVFEVTHIEVQNYTLDDIKAANMPSLEQLVEEYYSPEFARMSEGDFHASMERTKKVIMQWK